MGPWGWGPFGTGPRRWSSRPGAFDAPFDDRLLVAMLLNFDLPDFSRDGDTGEEVPPSAPEPEPEPETTESETNTIRIDTRRFNPEDIRVSFSEGELRVSAAHTDDSGEQVTLTRSATLRPGSKVTARLAADGFLYIRAEEPTERDVPVQVEEQGQE
ncbi:hypothetical protein FJT64_007792 [Amphibalanus amphitrite]|uniref:SHSP domain-containing protein n=1 Tax=Amphibalanus amphitrite TaxID=1232801 RepID=A0A6A4VJ73_AMPAM|nr:hypothetical protein FJT64_007792 [Amphibalanus amphitrite]